MNCLSTCFTVVLHSGTSLNLLVAVEGCKTYLIQCSKWGRFQVADRSVFKLFPVIDILFKSVRSFQNLTFVKFLYPRVYFRRYRNMLPHSFYNITSILTSPVILVIWLALAGATDSRIAPLFALNRIFQANYKALLEHNQSHFKACLQ